ncbi:glycosyltransferase family 2 protein [Roseobacter weihaiensis]|uniref:glycosyltransferase family 2 protein n=1 Tax=Roseobacter weihaiensis TaxID=2763262 RepID=UPI001D0B3E30|nr:glycosyltransferase [Roseobacter sp. H9]
MSHLISIVIPTFRRPDFLRDILSELTAQLPSDGSVEVVIVDNDSAGSARSAVPEDAAFRYIAEPRPGVAHARNTGVMQARGRFILFLDDDEMPGQGWLAAFLARAQAGDPVCFGPVQAQFTSPPPEDLAPILRDMFSRILPDPDGAEISGKRAYLGTGNSMFDSRLCFDSPPFDTHFNGGGEDVWLLRHLAEDRGLPFYWIAEAVVYEQVPAGRSTLAFIQERKYLGGMLRCVVESGAQGPARFLRLGKWMAIGAAQVGIFGSIGQFQALIGAKSAPVNLARSAAGRGKLMWWRHPYVSTAR